MKENPCARLVSDWSFAQSEEMHRVLKRDYYAACYGNYKALQVMRDFFICYNMGQEL